MELGGHQLGRYLDIKVLLFYPLIFLGLGGGFISGVVITLNIITLTWGFWVLGMETNRDNVFRRKDVCVKLRSVLGQGMILLLLLQPAASTSRES